MQWLRQPAEEQTTWSTVTVATGQCQGNERTNIHPQINSIPISVQFDSISTPHSLLNYPINHHRNRPQLHVAMRPCDWRRVDRETEHPLRPDGLKRENTTAGTRRKGKKIRSIQPPAV
ncbi:uncharacterized protein BO97DRAFT_141418 [Aspergillus homomorphus CBS 101889]|uniref:Uncharacterized protein n=1 Tax=Aspergillus homomorphus (strain CBS 101889) TaxID=1450537 RepID=A0A395HQW6_ASPHC|nr:hypothetical protein BO97DRAFT_141418 [Aspergillus homomorphus CBS 101889]RAL10342.1 hypothetical protein BO97DRAFT_141418 [Aspergillus homomorphus CBS 101889]